MLTIFLALSSTKETISNCWKGKMMVWCFLFPRR